MSQILVRNLSPETVEKLKKQAKRNNRSLEAEVRDILDYAANQQLTPAYVRYLDDLAAGKNRRTAFLEFIEERRRSGPSTFG